MNILLVYPQMPSTFWNMEHLMKIMGKKSAYPPLGLLTIAALLPEEWNIKLIDVNLEPLKENDIKNADLVFISAMSVQANSAREIIRQCKKSGAVVVAGGPLFTHEYELFDEADHFVLNEAEITLPLFLEDFNGGKAKRIYSTDKFAEVTQAPLPRWDLADKNKYAYGIVQYSRGCPYKCDFCDVTALFGRYPRTKTPDQIIDELNAMGDLSRFEMILFADDNLIGNKKNLKKELLPALIEWRSRNPYAPGFATQVTINLADDEEMALQMAEAGFRHIFVGIETPDEFLLSASQKFQNLKRSIAADIKKLQKNGFIVTGGFIAGFDGEDPESFIKQHELISETNIVIATLNLLKAPPGTELYEKMNAAGRINGNLDFDEYSSNIIPLQDPKKIQTEFRKLVEKVYDPEIVYGRMTGLLDEYRVPYVKNGIKMKPDIKKLAVLLRIIFSLFKSTDERKYCVKIIGYALKNRRNRMDLAFLFCALLTQFRIMRDRLRMKNVPDVSGFSSDFMENREEPRNHRVRESFD